MWSFLWFKDEEPSSNFLAKSSWGIWESLFLSFWGLLMSCTGATSLVSMSIIILLAFCPPLSINPCFSHAAGWWCAHSEWALHCNIQISIPQIKGLKAGKLQFCVSAGLHLFNSDNLYQNYYWPTTLPEMTGKYPNVGKQGWTLAGTLDVNPHPT